MNKIMKTISAISTMIFLLIAIFLVLTIFSSFGKLPFNFPTITSLTNFSVVGGGFINLDPDIPDAPKYSSCADYNFNDEFTEAVGASEMNAAELACENHFGEWWGQSDIVGCAFDSRYNTVDCSEHLESERFCEDYLKGDWLCSNFKGFVGCTCDKTIPTHVEAIPPIVTQCTDTCDSLGFSYDWFDESVQTWGACYTKVGEVGGDQNNYWTDTDGCCCWSNDGEDPVATVACEGLDLTNQEGDLGTYCSNFGYCEEEGCGCDHFWDWGRQTHLCSCTQDFFCGQYCYEYFYTNDCECPPSTIYEIVTRSTFQCVPVGYVCIDGYPEMI